jgi:hypothetical protein
VLLANVAAAVALKGSRAGRDAIAAGCAGGCRRCKAAQT